MVNAASLRDEFEACQTSFQDLCQKGKVSPECEVLFKGMLLLMRLMLTVFMEKTTRKGSKNSSLPPSQTDKDETAQRAGKSGKGAKQNLQTGAGLRKTTLEETATVEACDACGADLSDVDPVDRERRILHDIVFEVVERRVDAEVKECPECRARTKGQFPDTMPGPLQYGAGLQAFVVNLLVAHMLSLRRAVALVQAISGLRLSEATCLGYVRRLHDALASWEDAAIAHLLERPALHADETGLRVDGKTQWLHVVTDVSLTLKFLHKKRGKEAIEEIAIIPRYTGTLVHNCWAAYLAYDQCSHQLCGSHLLRELTFIVDSNGFRWARLMKSLLREVCHRVNRSDTKTLAEAQRLPCASDTGPSSPRAPGNCPTSRRAQRGNVDGSRSPTHTTSMSAWRSTKSPSCASWAIRTPASRTTPASRRSAWQRSRSRCRDASEPSSTPKPGAGSQAT